MTTYAFPSVAPTSSAVELASNTATFVSPISGAIQTIDRGGERWIITLQYQNLSQDNRATMQSFLGKLNGQQHRFTLHNHAENQRGDLTGTPVVNGASQTGTTLNIDGCTISTTDWMREGDWFAVNGELKMATADADSNGSGQTTLTFIPRLRTAPGDGGAITVASATGTFLLSDGSVKWSNTPGGFSSLSFTAVEDIAG